MTFLRIATALIMIALTEFFVRGQSITPPPAEPQRPASSLPVSSVLVPAGTSVPLVLITPIRSKSSKTGDPVRARVAFPITVDDQVAIPSGSYVEGSIVSMAARAAATGRSTVQIRFDRLLFANGYAVSLDAIGSQALVRMAAVGQLAWLDPGPGPAGQTQTPTLPPLPSAGPSRGALVGIAAGSAGVIVVLSVITAHHRHHADSILFESGSQFRMVLQGPLSLDPVQVRAAIAAGGSDAP